MKFLNEKRKMTLIYPRLQIVHLRVEDDAILHWSSQNKIKKRRVFFINCVKNTFT